MREEERPGDIEELVRMPGQCRRAVYKRDTYRRTGRGPSGFELYYTKDQCSRAAKHQGYCTQHAKELGMIEWR